MENPKISAVLLDKYLKGTCSENERVLVEAWYAHLGENKAEETDITHYEKQEMFTDIFRNISSRIDPEHHHKSVRFLQIDWLITLVASILLVVGYFYFQNNRKNSTSAQIEISEIVVNTKFNEFVNLEKQIVKHRLPDGSMIWMRPNAKVKYPIEFNLKQRIVQFDGEGFFDVQKDPLRPFYIHSGKMTIRVLGTSFNVKAPISQKEFKISVVSGSVEVIALNEKLKKQIVILRSNQQALFEIDSKRLYALKTVEMAKIELYQSTSFIFKNEKISEVIKQLEARFNIDIVVSDKRIEDCTLNANFENQPLPAIIEMLCRSLESSYTINENTIQITGAPCTI